MAGFKLTPKLVGFAQARRRLAAGGRNLRAAQRRAVKKAALLMVAELKKGITSGAPGGKRFRPLSPLTRLTRRGSKPLVDRGDLRNSISMTFDPSTNSAFVGVHRTAKSADGDSLVNVAAVHEFGTGPFVIPVTDRVRAFFMALSIRTGGRIRPISPSKTVIMHPGVPARPFIRPTVEKAAPKLQAVIVREVSRNGGPI